MEQAIVYDLVFVCKNLHYIDSVCLAFSDSAKLVMHVCSSKSIACLLCSVVDSKQYSVMFVVFLLILK